MKVLQVAPLVSPTGAFGGPLRVALNQCQALLDAGHDVDLLAGWLGPTPKPKQVDGVPVSLFRIRQAVPGSGFSGLFSVQLTARLARSARRYDIVHVHAGRDLTSIATMALLALRRVPYISQTHGMIVPDARFLTRLVDLVAIRPLLRRARVNLVLNVLEQQQLTAVRGTGERIMRLRNGVPQQPSSPYIGAGGDVLFAARLHSRKRPQAFVQAAALVVGQGHSVRFAMVGPDEGALVETLQLIRDLGLSSVVSYEGALPYDEVLSRVRRAGIYVLPSVNEPFPMSLLEALSLGVPSICTTTCGIADVLQQSGAALVVDGSPASIAQAVSTIITQVGVGERLSQRARQVVAEVFSMEAVITQLLEYYKEALAGGNASQ